MEFNLKVDMNNAAFDEDRFSCDELVRILRVVADKVSDGCKSTDLRDINGNLVGTFDISAY